MISEVYDAFIAAGPPEDKARKAAETLANYDDRFTRIDGAILKLDSKIDSAVSKLEASILKLDSKLDSAVSKLEASNLKLDSKLDGAVLKFDSEIALMKWMVGFGIAMNVAILTRLFLH